MTPEFYKRVREIFHAASDLSGTARTQLIDRECAGNAELLAEVRSLLEHHKDDPTDTLSDNELGVRQQLLSDATTTDDALPDAIGRYRILRRIGEGGMGIVFEARQERPRRTVALKLIRLGLGSTALQRRFQHEAEMLGRLTHAGIARIYEAGIHTTPTGAEIPYLAMELVEGVSIAEYVRQRNLSARERLVLFARVCDAIEHAHQNGVIHRDLKPANVLVDPAGHPKVLDFGIARATDADLHTTAAHTATGQMLGTLPYMSPEQVAGTPHDIDTRSDVYALGVLAYEMLADRLPLDLKHSSLVDAASVIRNQDPRPLGEVDRVFRGDVETIVAKALEKDRDRRYGSVAELGADVRRFLSHDPIVARPASTIYQLGKLARRHRGVAVGVCIAGLALIGGSAVAIWQGLVARSAQRIAERRFTDLHRFAESVILEYPKIKGTKGDTRAQEFLTTTTLEYLDGMARDTRGLDVDVLGNLALAYSATGDVLGRPNGPNLGDPKASRQSYEKAVALFEDLVTRAPDDIELNRSLAITYERIGNVYLQEQEFDRALEVYLKSHDLKLAIADDHDMGPRDLSFSYNKLGDVHMKQGRATEAYDFYARSLDIRRQLADRTPEDDAIQRAYTVGLNRVADVLLELGRETEALELCATSLQRRVDLAQAQPDNMHATMDLAVGHYTIAKIHARMKRLDDAIVSFEAARATLRRMAEADPGNTTAWLGAAEVSGEMGRMLFDADRHTDALTHLTTCVQESEQRMPDDKMTAAMREQLAEVHLLVARAHAALVQAEDNIFAQASEHRTAACTSLCRARQLYHGLEDGTTRVPPELHTALAECPDSNCAAL